MNNHRMTAVIVGILYIIGTVAGILSLAAISSILEEPETFQEVARQVTANENQVILGALFVLTMGLALALVPVMMFPILKQQNEALALGYVVFRGALETVSYLAVILGWLLIITYSKEFTAAVTPDDPHLTAVGNLLLESSSWAGHISGIIFPLGALMFYTLLYQMRLLPRWIPVWGLIAAVPYAVASFLVLFGTIEASSTIHILMVVPLAIQEMIMALWLIFRGFNSSAFTTVPT